MKDFNELYSKSVEDKQIEEGKGSKQYDKIVNAMKTVAYAFDDNGIMQETFPSLYKQSDTLLNQIQKKEKKIIETLEK